jgi:hypothetical protein
MYGTVLIANLLYVAKARSYYAIIIVVECQFDFGYLYITTVHNKAECRDKKTVERCNACLSVRFSYSLKDIFAGSTTQLLKSNWFFEGLASNVSLPLAGYGQIHSCSYPNPNNYYPLLTLPIPTHTQWITSFILDSIHTQSIICTLLTPYPPHFFNR